MRVLALTKYGSLAASTRQRFIQYQPQLAEAGIALDYSPLLDNDHLRRLVDGRRASPVGVLCSYLRRAAKLTEANRYDLLWVHCEYFPYLPGFIEAGAVSFVGRPIVFDFDDAIFHMYDDASSSLVKRLLGGKLEPLLRRATACLCGNEYLREYARQFNDNAIVLPTVVDTDIFVPRPTDCDPPVIGWIGSASTWAYVRPLLPLLRELVAGGKARVKIVGAGAAAEGDRFVGLELIEWSEEREVADLQSMDIGIMPLPDDKWARGKSGYKLVQYMACGLPVVASPVGVNAEMVSAGVNGFLAASHPEWREALERLLAEPELRRAMGAGGRQRVVADYSLRAHAPRLVQIMRDCSRGS